MNADWDQYKSAAEEALSECDYACAEIMWQAAYRQAQLFDKFDQRLAITLEGLAEALWHQQKFDEAEKYAAETLEFFIAARGPHHLDVGVTANNLAMLYKMQGKYAEAEPLYRQAIDILKVGIGSDHPEFQNILAHYAEVLRQTGRADEATRLTAEAMQVTSNRLVKSGQYQALELEPEEKLLEDEPAVSLPDEAPADYSQSDISAPPPMTWNQYRLAAEECMMQGDFEAAEALWRSAYRKTADFPPYDRRWCTTVESLSESLWKQGKYAEAEPLTR
ncbi:MAG TPA: tetratricopeptide repeat protein, partial [Chroococcales cyanobacterium]